MAFQFDWSHYAETWLFLAGDDNVMSDMISQPVKIPAGGSEAREFAFFPLHGVAKPDWVENGIAAEIAETNGTLAARFDAAPDYGVRNLRFVTTMDTVSVTDIFGATAAESLENLLRLIDDPTLSRLWKEVKNHE